MAMKHISIGGLDVSRVGLGAISMFDTVADRIELNAKQIELLNNLTPAAGERHDEGNMAVIDR